MMVDEYSVWLLPAPPQERVLVQTLEQLAATLDGPRFAPHVTIQGDLAMPRATLSGALAGLAARTPAQRWIVARVEGTAHFFRSLYLRFGTEPAFDALQQATRDLSGTAQGLSPYAHLSLFYGHAGPAHESESRALSQVWAGHEIMFDRLALCRSSSNVAIADWEVLEQFALQPSAGRGARQTP